MFPELSLIPLIFSNGYQLLNCLFRDVFAGTLRNVVQKDRNLYACSNSLEVLDQLLIRNAQEVRLMTESASAPIASASRLM